MTAEQIKKEKNYRAAVGIAKDMLIKRIINKGDFNKINKMLIEKYNPIIGAL